MDDKCLASIDCIMYCIMRNTLIGKIYQLLVLNMKQRKL